MESDVTVLRLLVKLPPLSQENVRARFHMLLNHSLYKIVRLYLGVQETAEVQQQTSKYTKTYTCKFAVVLNTHWPEHAEVGNPT